MPRVLRIPNLGEFDWDFESSGRGREFGHDLYNWTLRLCLRLDKPVYGLWRDQYECGAYELGKLDYCRNNWSSGRETLDKMPRVAQAIAQELSKIGYGRIVIELWGRRPGVVVFQLCRPAGDSILHPTPFLLALVRKARKLAREFEEKQRKAA